MSGHVCVCGMFHAPCAAGLRTADLAKHAREDSRYVAALADTETAWAAYQAGKHLPLKEWDTLEKAWHDAGERARAAYSASWAERVAVLDGVSA